MGAMLGVVLSDNLIILYLFWELTSFSSFLLISFWRKKGIYLWCTKVINHYRIWWIKFIRGFILISLAGDSLSLHELIANASEIQHSPLFIFAMVLIMLGAFTKSAQVPFYIWLPDAMEAPTPVSAYLHSATMVKAGLYLVARVTPLLRYHKDGFGQLL